MNTREAAAELNVSPKTLRRHLRKSPEWRNAGIGGTYSFTMADIRRLKRELRASPASFEEDDGFSWMNEDEGISVEVMLKAKQNPYLRGAIHARRKARTERLGKRMLELGIITPRMFERSYR